jgi:hypothetical protein
MGKGCAFTSLILSGYLAGAASKVVLSWSGAPLAPVFWLYVLNTLSVAVNLLLQWFYRPSRAAQCPRQAWKTRSALLSLLCAVCLCTPMSARTQVHRAPAQADKVGIKPLPRPSSPEDRRFSTAYGRFMRLADQGDASAANAALFMLRNGKALFGSDWSASEEQQAYWNALAVNAARHQFAPVVNRADD